jgi:site-specific DNA-methyltransferase (adenine-specific)
MKLILSGCLEEMKKMQSNSIDAIVTDPPYGLKFMGKKWDYEIPPIEIFKEILRIAKPGAFLLCFGGTRTFHRIACNIEDAGWEIRDTIMWIYGSGFPKSYNISKGIDKHFGEERKVVGKQKNSMPQLSPRNSKGVTHIDSMADRYNGSDITAPATPEAQQWDGYGTALKPAFEPIVVAMKPVDKNFVNNALTHGVAGLNIDGCRIEALDQKKLEKNWNRKQSKNEGIGSDGLKEIDLSNRKSQGRWPSNVILDEESAKMLDEQSGILSSGAIKSHYKNQGIENIGTFKIRDRSGEYDIEKSQGGASRFFYCAKASTSERNLGCERNNHPTVKPIKLMKYLCKLVKTPTGGCVLDPYMGSGATGIACKSNGQDFIGIELDKDYFEIAKRRINNYEAQIELQYDE